MAAQDGSEGSEALIGRSAVDWLFARPDGGHFFDGAVLSVGHAFGPGAGVGAFAPLGRDAIATDFFFAVQGDVEDDEAWEHLVVAHMALADVYLPRPRPRRMGRPIREPFEYFHLVLEPRPPGMVPLDQVTDAWLRTT